MRSATTSLRSVWLLWMPVLLFVSACGTSSQTRNAAGWSGRGAKATATAVPAIDIAEDAMTHAETRAATQAATAPVKARVYEAMARMSRAEAIGDSQAAEAALEEAMGEIRLLVRREDALQEPELRELYRSVVTAYEQYYGVSDSLMTENGEIFAFREEVFSALNALRDPLLEDVMLPPLRPVTTTIALDQNHLVEQSIRFLVRSPERHLYHWISRSATYFPMIEQILREEGVPDELKYLAMIESALNPRARSRVGAGGLWQFMPATGRAYGLQVTHWIDERSDPEKSTRAAARYLRDLYDQFGDWHLAMAAYNCGPSRVERARKQFEATAGRPARFWDIYERLPRETRNYVPMFIAAALVASDPEAFDLKTPQPGPRYVFDVVDVEGALDLQTAAELAGTDVPTLRALNPEIRQWTTPPSQTPYRLRVPAGRGRSFTEAFAALPADRKRGVSEYRVRRGDTLGRIARRYDTSVAALQEMNGLSGSVIHEGQVLYVPVRYERYAGADVPSGTPALRRPEEAPTVRRAAYTEPAAPRRTSSDVAPAGRTRVHYRVQRGDNLTEIAARYGVSVEDLKAWNGLSSDRIRSGQMLALYPGDAPEPAPDRRTATTYRVRRGDNLTGIAARYGVTVADLRAWNGLAGDDIRAGQRLTVYGSRSEAAPARATRKGWVPHVVRRGETLTTIARKYGATAADLRKWNDLQSDRLREGQRLAVYVR